MRIGSGWSHSIAILMFKASQNKPKNLLGAYLATLPLLRMLAVVMLVSSSAAFAKVEVRLVEQNNFNPMLVVILSEEIQPGDFDAMRSRVAAIHGPFSQKIIALNTIGGSVSEAMRIGEFVREEAFDAVIPQSGECQSSCIYILAAGIDKKVAGKVGVHRPYYGSGSADQVASGLKDIMSKSRKYFERMNIPESLVDEMFSVPPGSMKILSVEELARYRLNSTDIIHEEESAVEQMAYLGWSREKYEKFQAEMKYKCTIYSSNTEKMRHCIGDVAKRYDAPKELVDVFK